MNISNLTTMLYSSSSARYARICVFACLVALASILSSCSDDVPDISALFCSTENQVWPGFLDNTEYIAVFGDVQEYISDKHNLPYFEESAKWLSQQLAMGAPLRSILYTGDLTDENSVKQWRSFSNVALPLSKTIPSVACTGNHDYDWTRRGDSYSAITDRNSSRLSQFATFDGLDDRIVERFEPGRMENIIVRNKIAGRRIDIIVLEFGPRPEVISWAAEYLDANPERQFILLTHELLTAEGELQQGRGSAGLQFDPFGLPCSSPSEVVAKLIEPYPGIVLAICGHNGHFAFNEFPNVSGGSTPVILYNLQYLPHGGDSEIMLLGFGKHNGCLSVNVVNLHSDRIDDGLQPVQLFWPSFSR